MHEDPKKSDIKNIIKKLIETKNITSYQNKDDKIEESVSACSKEIIQILLLLYPNCLQYEDSLNTNHNI